MNFMRGLMLSKLIICLWSIYRFILGSFMKHGSFSLQMIINFHYHLFSKLCMKGRALLNAIGNLRLSGPYAEALINLGYNLEDVANQVFSYYRSPLLSYFCFC